MQQKSQRLIFWSANLLALLGFISLNIYLPSLPSLAHVFKASPAELKLSITLFLLGFAVSQFFWGSLSSRHGRKKVVMIGLLVAGIGTLIAMTSVSIWMFNGARLIEGIGIGSASVLCRALLTDALDKTALTKALSYISSLGNVMPALAPIIGGYIILFFSWRVIFLVLLIYTLGVLALFFFSVPETNANIKTDFKVREALQEYAQIFKHRTFLSYLIPYIVLSGGMIGYYAATPFIFVTALHVSAQHYAFFSIITVVFYIIGANIAQPLSKLLGSQKTIFLGIVLVVITAVIFLILTLCSNLGVWSVTLPMVLYTLAAGVVAPIATACALSELRHMAGASAAVVGASVYGVSALCTLFITSLNLAHMASLCIYVFVIAGVALLGFVGLKVKIKF